MAEHPLIREPTFASDPPRRPHAVLDLPSRSVKGQKIQKLLGPLPIGRPLRLLEVGCGSGGIAHDLGTRGGFEVTAVDTVDQRLTADGYRFQQVDGVRLPFPDGAFDVVVSNHVVEHVGARDAQRIHLAELRRVLAPGGIGYLAVPNRWAPVEPHFGVALLSWWPRRLRSPVLRVLQGTDYDCEPLGPTELGIELRAAGFRFEHIEGDAVLAMIELGELPRWAVAVVRCVPRRILRLAGRFMPTLVCRLHPAGATGSAHAPSSTERS